MCKITVIYRHLDSPDEEFEVKLNKDKYPSMETPYYVVAQKTDNHLQLEFAYSKQTTKTEVIEKGGWKLIIGEITGRVFLSFINLQDLSNYRLPGSLRNSVKNNNWNAIKLQNFCIGVEITETIANYISN